MNTTITIKVVQEDESTVAVNEAIQDAFDEFDRIVKKFTRFNEDSELSNLNRNAGSWVQVGEEFLFLVQYMLDLSKKTNGSFDPTVIDFLEIYGYDKDYDFTKLDHPKLDSKVAQRVKDRPSWRDIQLNTNERKIKLVNDQKIDLGGVGKGYAIDLAYDRLVSKIANFLIDAGGDIRCNGHNERQQKWTVSLASESNVIGELELFDEALASSGSWARRFKQFHHLINPETGQPKQVEYTTVFVKAPTAIEADGWATALFIDETLMSKLPSNLSYYFV